MEILTPTIPSMVDIFDTTSSNVQDYTSSDVQGYTTTIGSTNKPNVSSIYPAVQTFRLVVHIIVYLLGTTGNALVIWFCIFRMVKTVNLVWILNLAIADFTFTFFLPLRITYFALDNTWKFGEFTCRLFWFMNYLNLSVSVLQLMVISLDRYICVHFPVWCKNRRRLRLAIIIVTTIWIVSILFNIPYFIFEKNESSNETKTRCRNKDAKNFDQVAIVRFIFLFIVPFTIIISCYIAISLQIKRKGMFLSSRPFKIFMTIIISFFVCFFPYNLFLFLELFGPEDPAHVILNIKLTVMCLVIAHSCINPIIYILIGREFKKKFGASLQSVFEKALTEDVGKINPMGRQSRRENPMNSSDVYQMSITDFTE
ncbi:chemerin-like receptor 1 [Leptodactylus fuscus]|uniref:chemerin-like receptor 1 n=1 Tax=Leptodactylus fuscus TaxID=238119 RepID=UPI003F4EB01C